MGLLDALDRGLLDLIFPRDCAVTQLPLDQGPFRHLSIEGVAALPRITDPRCLTCGHPFDGWLEGDRSCPHCAELHPAFDRAICAFRALGPVRHILHRIKYARSPYLADDLVAAAATDETFRRHLAGSILVPVPLHTEKAWTRGYNQSERIATALARHIPGCTVASLLEKHTATESQTRLDRTKRLRNVAKAFRLKRGQAIDPSRRYVIIDDVLTTGATLHACAAVLRAAGATSVNAAALAHG
ncbi:MAG: phosphoribosyltransferase family protein [Verrucomicrobiota bacterium]|jgi:ComF family protein